MKKILILLLFTALFFVQKTSGQKKNGKENWQGKVEAGLEFGKNDLGSPEKVFTAKGSGVWKIVFWDLDVKHKFTDAGQFIDDRYKLLSIGLGKNWYSDNDLLISGGFGPAIMQLPIYGSAP